MCQMHCNIVDIGGDKENIRRRFSQCRRKIPNILRIDLLVKRLVYNTPKYIKCKTSVHKTHVKLVENLLFLPNTLFLLSHFFHFSARTHFPCNIIFIRMRGWSEERDMRERQLFIFLPFLEILSPEISYKNPKSLSTKFSPRNSSPFSLLLLLHFSSAI